MQFTLGARSSLDGVSLQDTVTGAAAFFDMTAGAVWLHERGNFDTGGSFKYRMLRYLVGALGVAVFYLGLDVLFATLAADKSLLGLMLRYGLVNFWIMGLAPVLFLRWGWAETDL